MRRALAAVGALACLAGWPAAAPARPGISVRISRALITVRAPGARAVITRHPFHLTIESGSGRPALAEVANRGQRAVAVGALEDPFGSGLDRAGGPTLYAPLSFLVGSERLTQYRGGLWGGDLLRGIRFGVVYSARQVLRATRLAGGVRLVLSTDDPSGRRLEVTVRGLGTSAIRTTAAPRPARGVVGVGDSFRSSAGEGFFGFGGRHNAVDQHGQAFSSFVAEENLDNYQGSPAMYPNGNTAAYDPQAEFFSSRPYGFLLSQPELARFKLDVGASRAWNVTASARRIDYVVAPGPAPRAMATLTALSGRQPAAPTWALGPMMDRLIKNVGESDADYEQAVASDLADIPRYHLPLTAYRLEGWGFPGSGNDGLSLHTYINPSLQAGVLRTLRRRGIHPLVYLRPWITPGSAPVRAGLVARTASGAPYYTTSTSGERIALLDFTNPAAVHYWQGLVARALNLGADGFMQDFGEEVLFDMHFHSGETGRAMHNQYPVLYARATREEFTRFERLHHDRGRFFFFTRAGYSGLPGSADFEGGNFPGDETTDFSHASGLASLASDMLGRAVDGAYGYGTDIGGYYDLTTPATTKELFLRWAEWAALSPVFRLHGSGLHGTHTPWSFDTQTVRVYNALSRLHLRAVPLIASLWRLADRTGMPITRPLWLADPGDPRAMHEDQEWLLGPNLLVAPIVRAGVVSRSVFFPPGCWRSPSGAVFHGGSATVHASLTQLPYFGRCRTRAFAPVAG